MHFKYNEHYQINFLIMYLNKITKLLIYEIYSYYLQIIFYFILKSKNWNTVFQELLLYELDPKHRYWIHVIFEGILLRLHIVKVYHFHMSIVLYTILNTCMMKKEKNICMWRNCLSLQFYKLQLNWNLLISYYKNVHGR